jgi:hypothetical protein
LFGEHVLPAIRAFDTEASDLTSAGSQARG